MADAPKYVILHNRQLDALMNFVNEQTGVDYVVYGGLQYLNDEYVQIMVKRDDQVKEQTADLVWKHFKNSGLMIQLSKKDSVARLMRDATPEIVEALIGEELSA